MSTLDQPPTYLSATQREYPLNTATLNKDVVVRPIWVSSVSPEIRTITPRNKFRSQKFLRDNRVIIKIVAIFCSVIVLIAAIVIIIIYGITPCSLTKCHSKASICVNYPFYPRCICDYGYQGNGKQFCDECGVTFKQPNLRIVGGITTAENSWPFAVYIVLNYKTIQVLNGDRIQISISFLCGGTLINRKTVLSASHCNVNEFDYAYKGSTFRIPIRTNEFYSSKEQMMSVHVGVHDRNNKNKWPAKTHSVAKIIIHDAYDDQNILSDLSILKLDKEVELNEFVQVACLPSAKLNASSFPEPGTTGWIVGWGLTTQFGESSTVLKNARVSVYKSSYCEGVVTSKKKKWNEQICAGEIQGGVDTCQGDSGGALYVNGIVNNRTKFIAAGVVSYGEGCALPNYPGIYTRTSFYLDWIDKHSDF